MSCFSNEFNKSKEFISLSESIDTFSAPVGAIGLSDVAKCFAVHAICEKGNKAFVITPDEATAVKVKECLRAAAGCFAVPCKGVHLCGGCRCQQRI